MEFIPSTNLKILRNVPLDNSYKDTLTFNNVDEQTQFFSSKMKIAFDNFTFQRLNSSVRVPCAPNDLYDCNYIMFQNENFGNKWFYGFIKEINYLNQNVSEVIFELDVIQTWYFNFEIRQCFVEREHVNNDSVGANTLPENLETGPYITTAEKNFLATNLNVYILATEPSPQTTHQILWRRPAMIGGFPNAVYWRDLGSLSNFDTDTIGKIVDDFAEIGKSAAIVSIFTAPSNMLSTSENVRTQIFTCAARTLAYTPKNNKLYSYPYCSLSIAAGGQGVNLQYELFSDTPALTIRGGFGANMQVSATPRNYEGQAESVQNTLSLTGFPLCAWSSDYYQNWLAQNKANLIVSSIGDVVQIGAGAASGLAGGSAGGIVSGVMGIANKLATDIQHQIIPDQMTGSAAAADIYAVSGKLGFYSYCRTIKAEYAKKIDDFFTMFGYKVNEVKNPNIKGRRSWNYVKTIDSVVTGSIPVDTIKTIRNILNTGITFWHGDFIGDYGRDNSIV